MAIVTRSMSVEVDDAGFREAGRIGDIRSLETKKGCTRGELKLWDKENASSLH
jgi:hypothetical protein